MAENFKILIDQLIKLIELSNDHSHLGKFKWLLKYRNYKNSVEELEAINPHDKVVSTNDDIVVDNIHPSPAPMGSTSVKRMIVKNKARFLNRRRRARGA